ncbi:MAG: phosphonoacetaldehyde reductase [Candidatus Falkowbacteria bacterium]|nr:phosphonoacetaldehyde reductase [Candidatus Falkowbacteria bacterium]
MPQKNYIGIGAIKNLAGYLRQNKVKKVFLVSGKKSYKLCGAKKILDPILKKYSVLNFTDFSSNPKLLAIEKGAKLFKKYDPDLVIAIGGGSAIDMAKAINILAVQDGNPRDYVLKKKEITKSGKKLIAVPTTAGTGSEATCFAVVYINKVKYSLKHKFILPTCFIIDPRFTFNLNQKITAETGADALAQAIESYWSVNSTAESKKYAARAIRIILKNLYKVVNNPDQKSRLKMSRAANLSGRAINITETTACHAISYPITSYFGIAHGQAVVMTLSSLLNYNNLVSQADVLDKRGALYVKRVIKDIIKLLGAHNCQNAQEKIESILKGVGLATRFRELNIFREDLKIIFKNSFNPERMKNNPRLVTKKELWKMLLNLL